MNIEKIIEELILREIIDKEPTECKPLNGGTVSELYLLYINEKKYVVKSNEPAVVESEAHFLIQYKESDLLPNLIFVEESYQYLVYSFVDGSTEYIRDNKRDMLINLVRGLLNDYKIANNHMGWGWADQPSDSWKGFLMDKIKEAKEMIGFRLDYEDYEYISNLVQKMSTDIQPYLLHGDCGVHNFIFNEGTLCGVIDPTPVIGDPIYDLIYAFCSSPDNLSKETIDSAMSDFMIEGKNTPFLYDRVMIGLYIRLGICIKHHPHNFEEYLKAWYYWRDLLKT
ncbi:aminoglycoside phosphotransferase family protein [Fictibacillus phosphorivorans]|uniref:aminoglycoside phosphotransferase family protein n=1 Tax=Fictibacillus phosphorivorans TaxID=1221500 RepID=UPI0012934BA9|nr:aminoglycoside phosphotransferase family protein [Fictibacillus phosphorivorans]MQR94429.1 aminoglycoside phosphotransferase family protein [Fictibacillus phosphorivorans]